MTDKALEEATIAAALRLNKDKDDQALVVLLGLRQDRIKAEPKLGNNPDLPVEYNTEMGALEQVRALGLRILGRWNKELHGTICGSAKPEDKELTKNILDSLNLGETALIAAVVPALLFLGAPAALAAALAPFIVRKFIYPAKDELCKTWGELTDAQI